MPIYNAITGLKKKRDRRNTTRKKRESLSSAVSSRMHSDQAMEAFDHYMLACKIFLRHLIIMCSARNSSREIVAFMRHLVLSCAVNLQKSICMVQLDSQLMDITPEAETTAGHSTKLKEVRLEDCANDDQITTMLDFMNLPEHVRVHCDYNSAPVKCYKFHREALFIYMLRKMNEGCTHNHLAGGDEFGGDDKRWGTGYKWMAFTCEAKLAPLVSPQALKLWAPHFPRFAEAIRLCLMKEKKRKDRHGNIQMHQCAEEEVGAAGEFNIFSFTDCTVYETCRPGSGPMRGSEATIDNERRPNWCIKQRAFYDGCHKGMEACVKVLTIYLPNGLTAALCGPTSGRREDKSMFKMGELDDCMMELCVEHHAGDLCCICGDIIFAGHWCCLRTAHVSSPTVAVTPAQSHANDNMCSAREFIECSCARAEVLFPLLTSKTAFKLDATAHLVMAEIRAMHVLTNTKTCCCEGAACAGTSGFQCDPPSLDEHLAMAKDLDGAFF